MNLSILPKKNQLLTWAFIANSCLLAACGGGGGSGGGSTNTNTEATPPVVTAPSNPASTLANAGADLTVNAGTKITLDPHAVVTNPLNFKLGGSDLEITGSSSNKNDVVGIRWKKITGPSIGLSTSSTTDGKATFIAPDSLKAGVNIEITYQLTLTFADGKTANDSVTFIVNHVNQAPIANAGAAATIKGTTSVALAGTASDADGSIKSYSWTQTSGTAVTLSNANALSASFTAPDTRTSVNLSFQLTVTDDSGATASSPVTITVTPFNAPNIELYFPTANGIYTGSSISASGYSKANNATITSVVLSAGSGEVVAKLNNDGTWRADNIPLPKGAASIDLLATATDSKGVSSSTTSHLMTSGKLIGTGKGWYETLGVGINNATNTAYVFATGATLNDIRLFSIDLKTGNRSKDISNLGDSTQGIDSSAIIEVVYSAEKELFYYTVSPSDTSKPSQVISVSTITGQRTLISDATHGSGAALINPWGITLGKNDTLYVADNGSNNILSIDIKTGNRSIIASKSTLPYAIDRPNFLAYEPTQNRLYVAPHSDYMYFLGIDPNTNISDLISDSKSSSSLKGSGPTILGPVRGIAVDLNLNQLITIDNINDLFVIDLTTGNRKKVVSYRGVFESKFTYDAARHLLYTADGLVPQAFSVYDIITGQRVIISGGYSF